MSIIHTQAQVEAVRPLTNSIIELILSPAEYVDYQAGQYLKIHCGAQALSFSIANAPLGSHKYELHIRHDQSNAFSQSLFAEIKQQGQVALSLPYGDCHINSLTQRPIIFIAGGTGFAPVKAMIEQLLATGDARPFNLYWGARTPSDLYMDEKVKQWQTHVSHFRYMSLSSSTSKETIMASITATHKQHLFDHQIVLAGPFEMVYALRDALVAHGMPQAQLFSDAFSFEPQEK